ncbi:MAG: RluA family pseudouridine synthase [Acidimicrobiia bacterium]
MSEPDAPSEVLEFEVPESLAGERVDRAVAFLAGWPRADVQVLVSAGAVTVNGREVKKSYALQSGDVVLVVGEPEPVRPPEPADVVVPVVYADDDVIVVDKPAGMVVHPGAGHERDTVVNGLLAQFPEIAAVGDPMRPGIVHRLDRDTSGLLAVARSERAYESLVAQLAARDVERVYYALVWGAFEGTRGVIDAPIGRSQRARTKMAVREGGREARTHYEVLESFDDPAVAFLECRLETGRTHQIRVHLAAIDHPVVGDVTYRGVRPAVAIDRPFLHAAILGFEHPADGRPMRFESPLPPELTAVLAHLHRGSASDPAT